MTTLLFAIALILAAIELLILFLKRNIITVPPGEVSVLSGRRREQVDPVTRVTEMKGYRLITGGSAFRIPILERDDRLSLAEMSVRIDSNNLPNAAGQLHAISLVANCCIVAEEPYIGKAIVRFLGMRVRDVEAILKTTVEARVSNSLLESNLAEGASWPALEQRISNAIRDDLAALGVRVDNLIFRGPPVVSVPSVSGDGSVKYAND